MPKGSCPCYLYQTPYSNKPLEEIWADIQGYTSERFPTDPDFLRDSTNFTVLLPPLVVNGKHLKGLYMSNGVECIQALYPNHKDKFIAIASSMWSSYPWSESADAYLTAYNYPQRNEWFKKNYPKQADKILIPLHDADFTHELIFKPANNIEKDIDILTVGRLDKGKNLPILIKSLMIFESKYGYIPKTTIITGTSKERYGDSEKEVILDMIKVAGSLETLKKYVKFLGAVNYGKEIANYYSRSKCAVLTSIFEGKNRMINEAICCNTPIVAFTDLSKYTRGEEPPFSENAGIYADFSPESLADKLYYAINNYKKFTPRESYLKTNGRIKFVNKCIDSIPYYRQNIPDYRENSIENNNLIHQAMLDSYRLSFKEFIYGANIFLQESTVNKKEQITIEYYLENT